jgi:NADPH:quinone reductase-like Zn-dependent oxidoreductase
MRAAVIRDWDRPPVYSEFEDPVPHPGEELVTLAAAAVNVITLARAAGRHYTSTGTLPMVAGLDGVGETADGRRVYFQGPRPPFGALAELAPVRTERMVPVPGGLDAVTVAAAAVAGMSAWLPLTLYAKIPAGESVLVNGATGTSGRMAVQIAKHLGARRVIATGRDPRKLATLSEIGADTTIALDRPSTELREQFRREASAARIGVVLDYLWGPSAEALLSALGGPDGPRGAERIRYVSIGGIAGETIGLASALLRSSGIELLGSGFGSATNDQVRIAVREFLSAYTSAGFRVATETHPLSELDQHWGRTGADRRIVFTMR